MARPSRDEIDAEIVDRAAALFARQGFEQTSLQAVADAAGYSKAGLLHHFPSKEALREAVLAHSTRLGRQVVDQVEHLPVGADRDRRAVEALVDFALAHPGMVAFLLAPITQGTQDGDPAGVGEAALRAFGVDPCTDDVERLVRVVGALAALAVLTLAANSHDQIGTWRPFVLATCADALGHRRPGTVPPAPDQET